MDLTKWSLARLCQADYDCECGRHHSIDIEDIIIGEGVSDHVADYVKEYLDGRIFVVCDCHTYEIAAKKIIGQLKEKCSDVGYFMFPDEHLIPNETTLGRLLIEVSEKSCDLLIAVGSGSVNDSTRYIASRLKKPYMVVGTAPSMDGYAGDSCAIVCRGSKESFWAVYPRKIIADTHIMANAPHKMLCAGFGDVIGKYIALADWELARRTIGEYYCESVAELMRSAVKRLTDCITKVCEHDTFATGQLVEALCLAGMTMGLTKVTRPASGSEHHLTHYCDIDCIKNGRDYPLHGISVGIFAVVMARFYEMARRDGYTDIETPTAEEIRTLLLSINAPTHPKDIGISKELFYNALMESKDLRPRYAMLKYAYERGFLYQYVDVLVNEYYPNN